MKKFLNALALLIGLGLIGYALLSKNNPQTSLPSSAQQQTYEKWNLVSGSVYDGDTLRAEKDGQELKIRFCGIDAPEKNQEFGIESRDYLRLGVELGIASQSSHSKRIMRLSSQCAPPGC